MSAVVLQLRKRRPLSVREELEELLNGYAEFVDWEDQDSDGEDAGDFEPSLGWTHTMATGGRDDLELV